jgi:beta-lactam-binding protein with PASTA domain
MGLLGVNVDRNPLDLENDQLTQAQNAISDSGTGSSSLRKRPGLVAFNTSSLGNDVLGGAPVPGPNLSTGGSVTVYVGRGPTS